MARDPDVGEDSVLNHPVLADQERRALYADPERTIDVIHRDYFLARVTEQGEWQLVLVAKFAMTFLVLRTDTGDRQSD